MTPADDCHLTADGMGLRLANAPRGLVASAQTNSNDTQTHTRTVTVDENLV